MPAPQGHRSVRAVAGSTPEFVVLMTAPPAVFVRSANTRYPVMADPPLFAGGVQFAVAVTPLPAPAAPFAAVPMTGAPGTVATTAGVTVFDGADSTPRPTAVTARTRKLYAVPFVSPAMVVLVAVPVRLSVRTTVVPLRTWTR